MSNTLPFKKKQNMPRSKSMSVEPKMTREGRVRISGDQGVEWSGFRFVGKPSEQEKALATLYWARDKMDEMIEYIEEHGMPPGTAPEDQQPSEVVSLLEYRVRKHKV